jgi:fumarylacetoacetase
VWARTRAHLQTLLSAGNESLSAIRDQVLLKREGTELLLPVSIGDYTDFYSSIDHATNVGRLFRPDNPLLPNYRHIPIGYHGRASSIVVSGTDVIRPRGQVLPSGGNTPIFTLSNELDFELELAFIVGKDSQLGTSIPIAEAESAIFGVALFNDWTARDIQKWEYVPLGPFLGKSFASSLSPWIVPFAALEPFRVAGPIQEPPPLPYLTTTGSHHFAIELSVTLATSEGNSATVCRTNARTLYWSMAQQLAHHTSNGCNVRVGDIMASGTISGSEIGSFGSLLEASAGGKKPIEIANGVTRSFLEDGDSVIMNARAEQDGVRLGFGEVVGKIVSNSS